MALFKRVNGVRIEMTPEEEAAFEAFRTPTAEQRRKGLQGEAMRNLRMCDWSQLPDSLAGPDRADWMQYRAALRQILNNPNIDPDTPLPTPPGSFDEFSV